jgi:hypothetical protein
VVTDDNVMYLFGGFVVEGRLGFNVGELLAFDLETREFFYPKVTGDLPVRRNKHTSVVDDKKRMWVWGGSVWDHTGGSSAYASTATHYADLSDPRHVKWTKVDTKGFPPSQRRLHAAVHKNGVMYIIGGEDYKSKEFLGDVHALDLNTFAWSQPHVAGAAGGGRIRAAAVGVKLGNPAGALVRCGEGTPVPAITGELQPKDDKAVTEAKEKRPEPKTDAKSEKTVQSEAKEEPKADHSKKSEAKEEPKADHSKKSQAKEEHGSDKSSSPEASSKSAETGEKEVKHKEAALGVEGVDHRAIAAGWMPRGNVLVESQTLWSVDRDSESRVLSIASSLAKLNIPGVPKPVVHAALGKSHHKDEKDDEKKDDEKEEEERRTKASTTAATTTAPPILSATPCVRCLPRRRTHRTTPRTPATTRTRSTTTSIIISTTSPTTTTTRTLRIRSCPGASTARRRRRATRRLPSAPPRVRRPRPRRTSTSRPTSTARRLWARGTRWRFSPRRSAKPPRLAP